MSLCIKSLFVPLPPKTHVSSPTTIGPTQPAPPVVHSPTRPTGLSPLATTMVCTTSTAAKTKTRDNFQLAQLPEPPTGFPGDGHTVPSLHVLGRLVAAGTAVLEAMADEPDEGDDMKFRVERDALAEAVAWTARSLPSRPTVPVLAGVLLTAGEDGLSVS